MLRPVMRAMLTAFRAGNLSGGGKARTVASSSDSLSWSPWDGGIEFPVEKTSALEAALRSPRKAHWAHFGGA